MDNLNKIITKLDLLGSITNEVIKESSGWMVKITVWKVELGSGLIRLSR